MRSLLVLAILSLAAAPAVEAQRNRAVPVHRHNGFWFSLGAGGGWDAPDGRFGTNGRGGAGYIRLGGTPHPQFLFGAEINGWENSAGVSRGAVTATALLYPSRAGGPFVKTGFGAAHFASGSFEAGGIATTLGLGADIRLGRNFYLTPNLDWLVQFFEDDTRSLVLVSIGATWH